MQLLKFFMFTIFHTISRKFFFDYGCSMMSFSREMTLSSSSTMRPTDTYQTTTASTMTAFAPNTFLGASSARRELPTHAAVAPSLGSRVVLPALLRLKVWEAYRLTAQEKLNLYFKKNAIEAATRFRSVLEARNEGATRARASTGTSPTARGGSAS